MTTPRAYDLRRHQLEQHPDARSTCESCNLEYRLGYHSAQQCAAWIRNQISAATMMEDATSTIELADTNVHWDTAFDAWTENYDTAANLLSTSGRLPDLLDRFSLLPTISQSKGPESSPEPLAVECWNKSPVTEDAGVVEQRPICGHCHKSFGSKQFEIIQHLERHRQELNERHMCRTCDVSFVWKDDLTFHEWTSSSGHCGLSFDHEIPCTGHHTLSGVDREHFARD